MLKVETPVQLAFKKLGQSLLKLKCHHKLEPHSKGSRCLGTGLGLWPGPLTPTRKGGKQLKANQ
jgi:hypothetical protein